MLPAIVSMARSSFCCLIIIAAVVFSSHGQRCNYQQRDCICDRNSTTCKFNLLVEQIQTFASYEVKNNDIENLDYLPHGKTGGTYYFNASGNLVNATLPGSRGKCATVLSELFSKTGCSIPMTVDGKTYRSALTINGLIPGPNLIVHEGQTVVAHISNRLSSDTISIHWHGMHQRNTPWMDGVGGLSHCPITPGTNFTYIFKASPSGTFWYHSHSGTQRTDGLFGALIVKENVQPDFSNFSFQLNTITEHTLSLLDWQQQASEDLFTQLEGSLGFFPGLPIGEIPQRGRNWRTVSADGSEVGPFPYWSGLINGHGRHTSVPYVQSRFSIFNVQYGDSSADVRYRFRLIGAQSLYAYRFSISDHKLTVIATDGYLVRPVDVDYIIVHSGERYDFALKPKTAAEAGTKTNYLIKAETLEVNITGSAPYLSLNHIAEGILHYGTNSDQPTSAMYSTIAQVYNLECLKTRNCTALNCPFEDYVPSYNISCVKLKSLELLLPTPDKEMPQKPDQIIFLNFGFQGDGSSSAINGRNFILSSSPSQIQVVNPSELCQLGSVNCSTAQCRCTHMVDITSTYVEFVFSAVGDGSVGIGSGFGHPVHLHGHSFHLVDTGYGTYNRTTGLVNGPNPDVSCMSDTRCTNPGWRNGSPPSKVVNITNYTIRKDTIIVPAGGYVRVWIVADNPGYWFLHCHIEPHQMEGMSVIINEMPSSQNCPPDEMTLHCGDFNWNVNSFSNKIEAPAPCLSSLSNMEWGVIGGVVGMVIGFIICTLCCSCILYFKLRKKTSQLEVNESTPLCTKLSEETQFSHSQNTSVNSSSGN